MYKWACDIDGEHFLSLCPPNIKPQLIGYIGGEAGTGKSAVISALLTLSLLWGRRNTIETMAYMGLAGLNVEGDTIHSHRGLSIGLTFRPCARVEDGVRSIYLSIIDEISMLNKVILCICNGSRFIHFTCK
jgi:hypothetical protein